MATLPQVTSPPQASAEVVVNENMEALEHQAVYAEAYQTTTGLTAGYYGGRWGGFAITAGTNALTASNTNYVVVAIATGVRSVSTATTNWNDGTNYSRVYKYTTNGTAITATEDYRSGPGGVMGGSGASGTGDMVLASVQTVTGAKTFGSAGAVGKLKIAGSTSGALTVDAPAIAGSGTAVLVAGTMVPAGAYTASGLTMATSRLLGRTTASTGATEEITVGTGLSLSAGSLTAVGGGETTTSIGALIDGATGKTTPVDADELGLADSAASFILKKLTWANLKATAKTYFDTLYQVLDSDLTTIASLTATTDNFIQSKSSAWASRTVAQVSVDLQGTGLLTDAVGFRTIPQNSQSTAYTTVAADAGKHLLHPSADTTARTFTIDSNANVAYPVGTAITFVNQVSAGVMTIAITSDTMRLAGAGTTGSRTLAADGIATALKITSTSWLISGTGLT